MRPYLIASHDYRRTSAGIRVLHRLCDLINEAGGVAYVLADKVNKAWDTPQADSAIVEWIAAEGVVVYPETDSGNPLNARRVVRYLLNRPGYIRHAEYTERETRFCWCGLLRGFVESDDMVLTVSVVEDEFFVDRRHDRRGEVAWFGKGAEIQKFPDVLDCERNLIRQITYSWPDDREAIAALFQCSRIFYSYTDYTMLTIEARLCGCPTVVFPSGFYSHELFANGSPGGVAGLAWGPSLGQIERAMRTVGGFRFHYLQSVEAFPGQFARFLEITQEIP